jgi:N-acetylglutamate synthase-like GNAT family acetyltransferase
MIPVTKRTTIQKVIEYLKTDIHHCLYLYIDIKKYGIENENLDVWIDSEIEIQVVIMKYYSGVQIFSSNENFSSEEVAFFLKDLAINTISGKRSLIHKLSSFFPDNDTHYGHIAEYKGKPQKVINGSVENAKANDLPEIAALVCSDPNMGANYQAEELAQQYTVRQQEKFGRNKIIKIDDRIVAHAATYAELSDLAIVSGVITDVTVRNKGLGSEVMKYLISELSEEGKRVFLFYYEPHLFNFYHHLGFDVCGETGKIVKRN